MKSLAYPFNYPALIIHRAIWYQATPLEQQRRTQAALQNIYS
jgi:hypothetical protein